ncbi:MAG: TolC family protein [Scytolyngbya sp. HA4215-MV1]|jgi:OMF family outer membrane factor|nr:TolC family protein [Scytolyngbya sp. HA4215-MV1]
MRTSYLIFVAGVAATTFSGIPGLAQSADSLKLNSDPNRLARPTQPQAVKIERTEPLTLQQAIELAQQQNRQLQAARLQVDVLRATKRELQATKLPNLTVTSGLFYQDLPEAKFVDRQVQTVSDQFSSLIPSLSAEQFAALVAQEFRPLTERELSILRTFNTRVNALTNQALSAIEDNVNLDNVTSTTSTPFTAAVTLNYNLDLWGGRSAAVQVANKQIQIGELDVKRQSEDVKLLVTLDYYTLQEADELVRIGKVALANASAVLRDAEGLNAAGVGTNLDVQRTQVLVANIQQDLELALTLQKNARRVLAQRLAIAGTVDIAAADPVKVAGTWPLSMEESIVQAYKNRGELDELLLQRDVTQLQRKVDRALNRPSVGLFASYRVLSILDSNPNPGLVDGYAVGGTLVWNLYDGGATNARINRQQTLQEIVETRFAEARDRIRLEVERSYNDLQASSSNIQTASASLAKANEVLRLSRIGFGAGVVTQLEVTTAQTDLTRTETNLVRSILNYNRALVALERAVNLPSSAAEGAALQSP